MAEEKIKSDETLAQEREERRQEKIRSDKILAKEREDRRQEKARSSLVSVLTSSEFLEPFPRTLTCEGSKESHMDPPNQTAKNTLSSFSIHDLVAWNKEYVLELGKSTSKLRATIGLDSGAILTYTNEAEVQHIVHLALQDATSICNHIIEKKAIELGIPKRVVLKARLESPLFSNRCDHVVVYDSISNTPVFVVETKKPWGDGAPTSRVFGQVFDQLKAMSAWGHTNPYGALTSFDSTYIVQLNKTPSKKEAKDWGLLKGIVGMLAPRNCDQQPSKTPSPLKKKAPQTSNTGARPFRRVVRHVYNSKRFESHEMVSAFVDGILLSLKGMKPRKINDLREGSSLNVEALSIWKKIPLDKKSYEWGQLQMKYKGPLLKNIFGTKKFYLVDYLGTGATSKAFRALTDDGYGCVVKIYVKRYVDKIFLETKDFNKIAKAAVKKEVKEYHTIYPALKGCVGSRFLNRYHCVIHPFFEHPPKDRRNELEGEIKECLQEFGKHKKKFHPHDQLWQHVGYFDEKLYLFDLGNLDKFDATTDTIDTVITSHYARLMSRT